MFINGSSVFGSREGAFSDFIYNLFGSSSIELVQLSSSVLIIFISLSYSLWLWKKVK